MSIPTDWLPLPLDTDPLVITERTLDGLQAALGPAWTAHTSAPEVALAEEIAREQATTNARVATEFDLAAAWFGISVHQLPVIAGARATLPATVTVTAPGAQVPAGLTVTGTSDDGTDVAFLVAATTTATGLALPLTLLARDTGTTSNGVPPGPLRVNNATAGVIAVTATATSADGVDPETLLAYLTRLRDYVGGLTFGGVRADALAGLARNVPGVQRALAIDLLDVQVPGSDPVTQPAHRTVSIFPVAADGDDVSDATLAAVKARIESVREVNFIARVAKPTRTPVTVAFTGIARQGTTPALVRDAVVAAVRAHLSGARWGGTPRPDASLPTDWTEQATVRWLDLVRAVSLVDGLIHLTAITLNGGQADVVLPGPAALPVATVTGTVT